MAGQEKNAITQQMEEVRDIIGNNGMAASYQRIDEEAFSLEEIMNEVRAARGTPSQNKAAEPVAKPMLGSEQAEKEQGQIDLAKNEDETDRQNGEETESEQPLPDMNAEEDKPEEEKAQSGETQANFAEEQISRKLDEIFGVVGGGEEKRDEDGEDDEEEEEGGLLSALGGFVKKFRKDEDEKTDAEVVATADEEGLDSQADSQEDSLEQLGQELVNKNQLLRIRFFVALAVGGLLILLTFAEFLGVVLPTWMSQTGAPETNMYIQLVLSVLFIGVAYEEMGKGLRSLFSLAPDHLAICVLAIIASLFHGLMQIFEVREGEAFSYFGAAAAAGMLAFLFARYMKGLVDRKNVQQLRECATIDQLVIVQNPQEKKMIVEELGQEIYNVKDIAVVDRKRRGKTFDTAAILNKRDESANVEEKVVPPLLILIIVCTAVVMLMIRQGGQLLTVFTVFTVVAVPLSAHFSHVIGLLWARRRSPKSVILNQTETVAFCHCDGVVFTDRDLFDKDSILLKGMRVCGGENKIDELIVDMASVCSHLDMAISSVFMGILENNTAMLKAVSKVDCYKGEGVRAMVGGAQIVAGTYEYLRKCDVISSQEERKEPRDKNVHSIYVAKNGKLACIFMIGYVARGSVRAEMANLYKKNVNILLNTHDMNLTAKTLSQLYTIGEDGLFTIDTTPTGQEEIEDLGKGIYVLEEDMFSFSDTLWACKRVRGIQIRSIMIGIVLAVLSLTFFFALMALNSFAVITAGNLLAYLFICTIPAAVNSAF